MNPLLSALNQRFRRLKSDGARARTCQGKARLCLEVLEDRTVPTAVATPANLVSWWTANSTAADAMGLNNATLTGVNYATGEVGKAFSFDGVDDWAALGDPSSLAFTASFSIEGWIKVNGLPTNYNFGTIMFRGDDRGGLDPYQLVILPNGDLEFGICSTTASASVQSTAPVPLGQFVHVAATLDDGTGAMTLYENGVVVAQTTTTVRPFGALDPTQQPGVGIGNSNALSNYDIPFNGLIDELSVYDRALTAGEVLGIYKAGSSGKVVSPITVSDPSVLEGAAGTTTPLTFTITRTGSLTGSLTVNWTTADDTAATANSDYVAASGTVTFAAGQATQTVQVTVIGDNIPEPNEDFKLIATPVGGTSIMGLGTILNDDSSISVGNGSAVEGGNTLKDLGSFIDNGSGGLSRARSSIIGPDGDIYVASADTNSILRYDPTGEFINAFVPSGSSGLSSPWDLVFGPDGNLYVSSNGNNEVLSFDGSSGAFLGVVASGLSSPGGLTFGPDGSLYIANQGTNEVLRYNGSGLSSFVTAGSGGLSLPRRAVFGPDGNLYVASDGTGQVLRYNGQTGAFIDVFATCLPTSGPIWLEFGTDGYLYATAQTSSASEPSILRFNAATGALVDSFALGWNGWSFNLGPNNLIYDSSNSSGGFINLIGPSSIAAFTVSLAAASAGTTTVNYSTADGTALAGSDYVATSGTLTFAPGETAKTILVPTLVDGVSGPTKGFTVNLSNPTSGVITNGQGIGTIIDDTQFYVVDGGSSDATYQYASGGAALGNNALTTGDTAPRGVATTAAGTTEWVVDANKNVYVYSTGGTLFGSWSAGGLSSSAQLTGITTDGTNIWLVDSYADKVYKYTGAASRLSGSQSAASSFALVNGRNGDTNPQDIVTDGTSIWVVDGTALKVFKYTLTGSSLGSWSIDPANTHPTGITIDPTNVSSIWIVDNGTDKVYQYVGAASRASGSQNAAATFALNPNDTNPQGIADPPPADMLFTPPASSLSLTQQTVADFNVAASSGLQIGGELPPLAGHDAAFTMLARESFMSSSAFVMDNVLTPAGTLGAEKSVDELTPLTPRTSQDLRSEGEAVGLLDGIWADEESQASVATTDSLFAMLAHEAWAEKWEVA